LYKSEAAGDNNRLTPLNLVTSGAREEVQRYQPIYPNKIMDDIAGSIVAKVT